MAQVKLKEEQELREPQEEHHRVVREVKQEPEVREIQTSVLQWLKEEAEEVEIKPEPLPQFLQVSVKSEEGEPQSSRLRQTGTEENREDPGSDDTDDSEDWAPSSAAPQTQPEGNRRRSDSESSWEFDPPPAKTRARTKRQMEDLTASVCGRKYWPFPKKRPFKCPVCGKCFITRTHQKRHVSSHTGEYTWNCSLCAEVFRQQGHLRMHMKRHKDNVRCSVCGMPFSQIGQLRAHMRSHIEEKRQSCVVCDMKFPHLCALDRHMRTHARESPFTCRVCAKQFKQIGGLKSHMKVHSREKAAEKAHQRVT